MGLACTEDAWTQIEAEPVEILDLLIGLVSMGNTSLHVSLIRRAIFENTSLRHHAGEISKDAERLERLAAVITSRQVEARGSRQRS